MKGKSRIRLGCIGSVLARKLLDAIGVAFVMSMLPISQVRAQADFGMNYELGVEKKLSRKWNVAAETELRTRNNSRTLDRWSMGMGAEYKLLKGLKVAAGYTLLYDNNKEVLDLKRDGLRFNKYTPSYWGIRHRIYAGISGSIDWQRFTIGLRERWQFTHRIEANGKKFDFDEETWTSVKAKDKHVLRSRLQIGYDIAHWKFDPTVNVELFHDKNGLQKVRYQLEVDYKLHKTHVFSLTYRFQKVNSDDDDNDIDSHLIGLGYKYKF